MVITIDEIQSWNSDASFSFHGVTKEKEGKRKPSDKDGKHSNLKAAIIQAYNDCKEGIEFKW